MPCSKLCKANKHYWYLEASTTQALLFV